MSLLSEAMESCTMLDKTTVPDGYGGFISQYVPGASFMAACPLMSSNEALVAAQMETKTRYNVLTNKSINLQYHDVFKRDRDGKIFRVTSDGDDDKTPESAALNVRKVQAEEWELPV